MKCLAYIVFSASILLGSCGEEKELAIDKNNLIVNDQPMGDSVCTADEMISNHYQHYETILNSLPAGDRSAADVRKAFKRHLTDSSTKELKQGVITYYLGPDYGLRLHSKTLPNHLDSVTLFKIYNSTFIKEKK